MNHSLFAEDKTESKSKEGRVKWRGCKKTWLNIWQRKQKRTNWAWFMTKKRKVNRYWMKYVLVGTRDSRTKKKPEEMAIKVCKGIDK